MASNWATVFGAIEGPAEAAALSAALIPIIGGPPGISSLGGGNWSVTLSPVQEDRLTEWIITQLDHTPGPVQMDLTGVAVKVGIRKYWPVVLGLVGLGAVVGYYGGKR